MEVWLVRVDASNYDRFDDMVFFRIHGRERGEEEGLAPRDFDEISVTLKDKNLHIYAAQVGGRFVGWISIVYLPKVGWTRGKGHLFIDELWVNPEFRNRGIGGALLAKADAISKTIGVLGLRLYVAEDNQKAITLYEKCGYEKKGRAYFMEKPLRDDDAGEHP